MEITLKFLSELWMIIREMLLNFFPCLNILHEFSHVKRLPESKWLYFVFNKTLSWEQTRTTTCVMMFFNFLCKFVQDSESARISNQEVSLSWDDEGVSKNWLSAFEMMQSKMKQNVSQVFCKIFINCINSISRKKVRITCLTSYSPSRWFICWNYLICN